MSDYALYSERWGVVGEWDGISYHEADGLYKMEKVRGGWQPKAIAFRWKNGFMLAEEAESLCPDPFLPTRSPDRELFYKCDFDPKKHKNVEAYCRRKWPNKKMTRPDKF